MPLLGFGEAGEGVCLAVEGGGEAGDRKKEVVAAL
jgi:hypothetical protein